MNNKPYTPLHLPPVSPAAGKPLYEQLIEGIKREISSGRLAPHQPLPSFRELAEQTLVSLITVKRAYEDLEREGLIYCRSGLGTFVAERGRDRSRAVKSAHAENLIRQAIREARDAGLTQEELLALMKRLVKETGTSAWKKPQSKSGA